jgi:2-dehydro-3-deoxyphosphogluconate aldolase/(4S)-4-hydroxy-2-oxoglutarate aldolase
MERASILKNILDCGIIAVLRAPSLQQAKSCVKAVFDGGIKPVEITMTVPNAIKLLESIREDFKDTQMILGAGTVLDTETARLSIMAGAKFVVSPYLNPEIIKLCHRYGSVAIPGAMTVKEVIESMDSGAEAVKIFPANIFGPDIIKAIKAPLPQSILIPTGGVSIENVEAWFKAGASAVGVGGELTREAIKKGDWNLLRTKASQFVSKIAQLKAKETNS